MYDLTETLDQCRQEAIEKLGLSTLDFESSLK